MTLHERSQKNDHPDTILYEIDLLRHCAQTLNLKKAHAQRHELEAARAEYYLGIEGFLLHFRNLLAFFTSRRDKDTDLIINDPGQWAGRPIEQRHYSDLIKRAKEINSMHGEDDSSCYDQISKYLLHCTTLRYDRAKKWDVERMIADIDPILQQFEKRFARSPKRTTLIVRRDESGGSTASLRKI